MVRLSTILGVLVSMCTILLLVWSILSSTFVKRVEYVELKAQMDYVAESVSEIKERLK